MKRSPQIDNITELEIIIHLEINPNKGGSPPRERRMSRNLNPPIQDFTDKDPKVFKLLVSSNHKLIKIQTEIKM